MSELQNSGGIFDLDSVLDKIEVLETQRNSPSFWDDTKNAERVTSQLNRHQSWYNSWADLRTHIQDTILLVEMAQEEHDVSELEALATQSQSYQKEYHTLKVKALLHRKYDANDAFLSIQTGAGGTESCDWVQMLLRLYMRWCDKRKYKVTVLDLQESEGGVKFVLLQVKGAFAYGYLSAETGIHRLVRISPFDSNKRRHTTFASVHATPVVDDSIEIDIKPEDIRVDTYRASGAGGQHVNTTDSAVRITHLATHIVVQCQNERSQNKNKQTAMKILKSRLYTYFENKNKEKQTKISSEKKDISWGNQIRSYIFHPYNLVKDHRTNVETGNTQAVMDGAIDNFIETYLQEHNSAL